MEKGQNAFTLFALILIALVRFTPSIGPIRAIRYAIWQSQAIDVFAEIYGRLPDQEELVWLAEERNAFIICHGRYPDWGEIQHQVQRRRR